MLTNNKNVKNIYVNDKVSADHREILNAINVVSLEMTG